MIVSAGASVNSQNNSGLTPLHYAFLRGNRATVQFIFQNQRDSFIDFHLDIWALMHLSLLGEIKDEHFEFCINFLLDAGVSVN